MRHGRLFQIGGIISGVVLVAFGVVVIVLAVQGHNTVTDELKQQQITGTPDMTPSAIKAEADKAGLQGRQHSDLRRRGQGDRHRDACAVLRAVHEHPRARGDRWLRVLRDGPIPGEAEHAEIGAGAGRRHEQHRIGGHRSKTASRRRTAPATSG